MSGETLPFGENAVEVRNLYKSYDNGAVILDNLSMTVKKGTIYGLLGASGCGKTTLLSCVIGLKAWDCGEIRVFDERPSYPGSEFLGRRLGYVPQDIALYDHLSINEVIQFYGMLYNMSSKDISEQWDFLNGLLELPIEFKLISSLSGGQKRRASLALALLHSPSLLILDEPTVGLDPLLRVSIWKHMQKLIISMGTTIVITTHYIEEARNSHMVGVMRGGRILVEETPPSLLHSFNSASLEDAVLKICRRDEKLNKYKKAPCEKDDHHHQLQHVTSHCTDERTAGYPIASFAHLANNEKSNVKLNRRSNLKLQVFQKIQRIIGFSMVIMLTFARHPLLLALVVLTPTLQGTLTVFTMGYKPRNIHFGVVNNEMSNWTNQCPVFHLHENSCDLSVPLSCRYLRQLEKDHILILNSFEDEGEALDAVQRGDTSGYLVIPEDYSQHFLDLAAASRFALNASLEGSRIKVHIDNSQVIAAKLMTKHLFTSFLGFLQKLAESCNIGEGANGLPLHFRAPLYGNEDDDYKDFLIPGVMLSSLEVVVSILAAVIIIADRERGTLSRARVAGLEGSDVLISHLSVNTLVILCQTVFWQFTLQLVFNVEIRRSFLMCLVINILAGLAGANLGLMLGLLCNDAVEAMIIGIFLTPTFLLFGGVFFPVENMAKCWQIIGSFLPMTLPTLSMRSVMTRGHGFLHPLVFPGIAVFLFWIIAFFILSVISYRRSLK